MWENYTILDEIGHGGMGQVFRAYHKGLRATFAVKTLRQDLIRERDFVRFCREIEILKTIDHPNIVRVVDVSDDPKRPGFAMEFCSQGSVGSLLPSSIGDYEAVERIVKQVAEALKVVHSLPGRVVHRDIKPSNLLIGDDGNIKIADFGLAVAIEAVERVTSSNWVSVGFSPPEQLRDMRSVDERGDLFALGAVAYFLLTGRHVAEASRFDAAELGGPLAQMIPRMAEPDLKKRVSTAKEVSEALSVLRASRRAGIEHADWSAWLGTCDRCGSWAAVEVDDDPAHISGMARCLVCDHVAYDTED